MKKIFILASFAFAALTSVSCLKDLDALPLNPTDFTSEVVYGTEIDGYISGLAKVYHGLYDPSSATGIGNGNQGSFSGGQWLLNECSSDESFHTSASDTWALVVNFNTWGSSPNDLSNGIYANALITITRVNEFLIQTTDEKLDARGADENLKKKVHSLRAEAKFIRAFAYSGMIDVYGNTPFVDETTPIGKTAPIMISRKEAFDWTVAQLEELASGDDMPEAASNYPRADKGSVLALLARLYLNAEVYTGKAMWQETKDTCERLFKLGKYDLCPEYQWVFMGDNGENPAALKEIIFATFQDYQNTAMNWGGCTLLLATAIDADIMKDGYPTGFGDSWSGEHTPTEWVERFFHPTNVNYETGEYTIEDKRGQFFYIKGHNPDMLDGPWTFKDGWAVLKWSNLPHDVKAEDYISTAASRKFADTDFIYMRLAEVYLAYAEACLNLGQVSTGLPYINALRKRAGVAEWTTYDKESLFEESSREMYYEGVRRRDLIRWNLFCSADYLWHWKGGSYEGQSFPKYKEILPIPTNELQANPNLTQNPGYEILN